MPKTHTFTESTSGEPVDVVVDKIATYKHDGFSECTSITLVGGAKLGVTETVDEVRKVIEAAS